MAKPGNLYKEIDEKLEPLSFMMEAFSAITEAAPEEDFWDVMKVGQMKFDFPVEVDVHVDDEGGITLGSAPPTQYIETSFMPVMQNVQITIAPLQRLYGKEEQ